MHDVFTPDQAAAYLQVNRETVYRYIRDGRLAASRLGRAYRIPRQSVERLLWSTRTRSGRASHDASGTVQEHALAGDRFMPEQTEDRIPSPAAAHAIVERTAGLFRLAAKQPPATSAEETAAFEQGVADEVMRGTGG